MQRFLKDNSLSIVTIGLFLLCLVGQIIAGHSTYNQEQTEHGEPIVGVLQYLQTGHFGESVFENWESEFLQMGLYVFLTAFLIQKGSAESKTPEDELSGKKDEHDEDAARHKGDPEAPWPVRYGGLVGRVYENSLSLAFLFLFLIAFAGHAALGAAAFNADQITHGEEAMSIFGYMGSSRFWFESLQNWQSEFLAVASIVLLSIVLRQRGSPESKPVHAPLDQTGAD
jgi:hypothetical protein